MRRRAFVALSLAWLASMGRAGAQAVSRTRRVAFVPAGPWSKRSAPEQQQMRQGLAKRFAEQGFVEGRAFALEIVDLTWDDKAEDERRARAVIAGRPDAILVAGDNIGLFARLTKEIPIVFYLMGFDPLRAGYVESYRRPGGNVTGIMFYPEGQVIKSWELLKELAPKAKRIGVIWEKDDAGPWVPEIRDSEDANASRLGLELVRIVVPKNAEHSVIVEAIRKAKIDLLSFADNAGGGDSFKRFLEQARIPASWAGPGEVKRGGLLSSQPSWEGQRTIAVSIVARILRGESPATIPVHAPTRFDTAINLRTARAMGLTVPPAVLLRADMVFDE